MMAAINGLFSLIASFTPLGGLFIMVFLPLASAAAAILCKPKYVFIYVIAALGVSFALSAWNFQNTLFYTVPSIVTGTAFGLLAKKKVPLSLIFVTVSLLYMGFVYLSLPISDALYGLNPVTVLLRMGGWENNAEVQAMVPAAILLYSMASTALMTFVIYAGFDRFGIEFQKEEAAFAVFPVVSILFCALAVSAPFYLPSLTYVSLVISLAFSLLSLLPLIKAKKVWLYVLAVLLLMAAIIATAALYHYYPGMTGVALFSLYGESLGLSGLVGAIILARRRHGQIS